MASISKPTQFLVFFMVLGGLDLGTLLLHLTKKVRMDLQSALHQTLWLITHWDTLDSTLIHRWQQVMQPYFPNIPKLSIKPQTVDDLWQDSAFKNIPFQPHRCNPPMTKAKIRHWCQLIVSSIDYDPNFVFQDYMIQWLTLLVNTIYTRSEFNCLCQQVFNQRDWVFLKP